jgi:putative photosynthetic complex assembly protein 2
MADFAIPAAYAVLVWWFTTGIILFLDGLRPHTFRWSLGAATALLPGVLYAVHAISGDTSATGAYLEFTGAILVWGWLEMSFLMGFITGPRRHACLERCAGWRHFVHASQAIIWNELATVVAAACLVVATGSGPNHVALWTFMVLWAMRLSAKLNLFFGVPNLGEKFLPDHLVYLKSFFRKRSMNFLFPFSVTLSSIGVYVLVERYLAASDAFRATGFALIASLLSLAVIEHWFMVLPIPSEKMWRWAMRAQDPPNSVKVP